MSEKLKAIILKVLAVKPGRGETPESYTKRLFKKLEKIEDDDWDKLGVPAQEWVNGQITRKNDIASAAKEKREYDGEPMDWFTPPDAAEDQEVQSEPSDEGDVEAKSNGADSSPEDDDNETEQEDEVLHASESPRSKKASGKKKAAVAKPAKKQAVKKATAKKKDSEEHRGRKAMFSLDQKITPLVDENPHRQGSKRYKRWSKYRKGMSVRDALDAGLDMNNLRYSVRDKHIDIH